MSDKHIHLLIVSVFALGNIVLGTDLQATIAVATLLICGQLTILQKKEK